MLTYLRHGMGLDLTTFSSTTRVPAGFLIVPITSVSVDDLARLSLRCYINTPDWDLDPEYQTFEGCHNFISTLFRGEEVFGGRQGAFRGDLSFALMKDGALAGALYALFGIENGAFIIDFAVAPEVRGQGVGRMFLTHALERYKEAGYRKALLMVTASNEPAMRLYTSLGFEVEDTHTVYVDSAGTE